MTNGQRVTLGVGMMCFSLMGFMPPWVHLRTDAPETRVPAGYAFITIGAQIEPSEEDQPRNGGANNRRGGQRRGTYQGVPLWLWSVEIDTRRLLLQWLAVSLVTGGLVWFQGTRGRGAPSSRSR